MSDALVPPKPKEFDRTTSMTRLFERCGTRSIAVSTDGLSRLMVGGATPSRMARIEKIASTAPAAPFGVLIGFEHHDARALAHHNPVPMAVVRAGRTFRRIIE